MRRLVAAALSAVLGVLGLLAGASATAAPPVATPVAPPLPAGAVFFPSLGGLSVLLHLPHFCSASVVHSATRDLVLTAAHCVYGTGASIAFAPGFDDGAAPYGVWSVRRLYVAKAWRVGQDPAADVAVLEVAPHQGRRIEDVAGSFPLGAPAAGDDVQVLGYPMGSGGRPVACQDTLRLTRGYPTVGCTGLTSGVSGGPWLQSGRLVGVTGGLDQGGCGDTTYSAPILDTARGLITRAEAGRPGDVAPLGFLANAC